MVYSMMYFENVQKILRLAGGHPLDVGGAVCYGLRFQAFRNVVLCAVCGFSWFLGRGFR